jgi:hypothetical protein
MREVTIGFERCFVRLQLQNIIAPNSMESTRL